MTRVKSSFFLTLLLFIGTSWSEIAKSDQISETGGALVQEDYVGQSPLSSGCLKGATRRIRTLSDRYSFYRNGQKVTNSSKVGIMFSSRCKTVWSVVEGPIDTVVALEDGTGSIIQGTNFKTPRVGRSGSKMVEYSGKARACYMVPFGEKECTDFVTVP